MSRRARGDERAPGAAWVLEVRDNGRGIEEDVLMDAGSLGLLGMRERAGQIGVA
ncbi:MAG: hypothetical protein H7A46_21635 [Verrucomicrobiales bacterium]|nr:hypothetical protein [Verrucomicrobiales bacterium]